MQGLLEAKLDEIFPIKSYRVTAQDKPWINLEIKKLDRRKKKEYCKNGKSAKYLELLAKYNEQYQKAAKNHLEKNVHSLKEENPGKAFAI